MTEPGRFEELALRIEGAKAELLAEENLGDMALQERTHLQEWVLAHPQILGEGVRIITSEYDRWLAAAGDPVRDRLDVLGLGTDGRLVVAELKRGVAPHSVHMQGLNYAAIVSRLKPRDVAELYVEQMKDEQLDVEAVLTEFQTRYLLTEESVKNPRIALIASRFPPSVTAAVVWLNERGVDISLVRFRPYRVAGEHLVVTFSRFFPVPTAEDFTIGRQPTAEDHVAALPEVPWDEPALRRLADMGNPATLALMDLCAAAIDTPVTVPDIQSHADLATGQVRGQLAGFTMLLRNPRYGFPQNYWPVEVTWTPNGSARYTLEPALAEIWRRIREEAPGETSTSPDSPSDAVDTS